MKAFLLTNCNKILTFKEQKMVFVSPLNWYFLPSPGFAWANFLIFQSWHMNKDSSQIWCWESLGLTSYSTNKWKIWILTLKTANFCAKNGLYQGKNNFFLYFTLRLTPCKKPLLTSVEVSKKIPWWDVSKRYGGHLGQKIKILYIRP